MPREAIEFFCEEVVNNLADSRRARLACSRKRRESPCFRADQSSPSLRFSASLTLCGLAFPPVVFIT